MNNLDSHLLVEFLYGICFDFSSWQDYLLLGENVEGIQIQSYDFTKAFDNLSFDHIIQSLRLLYIFPSQALR